MESFVLLYHEWGAVVMLGFIRPLGLFVIMPMLSSKNLGGTMVRNGLIILISIPALPVLNQEQHGVPVMPDTMMEIILLWGKEFIIGVFIGFVAAIPFWALDSASYVIDTMRGSSMATVLNPSLGESSTIFGVFFSQLLTVLFFSFGGFEDLITSLYQSYQLYPPGSSIGFNKTALLFFKQQWDMLFEMLFSFGLPAIGIMLLVDIGLGLLNRAAQQMNIFFLAMPIKSALVLLLLIISLPYSLRLYQQHMLSMGDMVTSLWRMIGE